MTTDDHTHPSPAHKAGCPVCNPDKTVPELNDAYRASNDLLERAVDFLRSFGGAYHNHALAIDNLRVTNEKLRATLADPPADVQEVVLRKLGLWPLPDVPGLMATAKVQTERAELAEQRLSAAHEEIGQLRAPETKAGQDAEQLAWALAAYECGQTLVNEGGGDSLHVRQTRALGILFAEVERLEKIAYPIGRSAEKTGALPYLLSTYRSEDRVVIQCESVERADETLGRVMQWLHSQVKTSSDSARLDWVLRNVSGLEWRRLGIEYSAGMTRDDLDKRIAPDVKGDA